MLEVNPGEPCDLVGVEDFFGVSIEVKDDPEEAICFWDDDGANGGRFLFGVGEAAIILL